MVVAVRGTLLALLSALAFGITTPLVQRIVQRTGAGPFATAMALYLGAALVGFASRSRREPPVERGHLRRLLAIAIAGAVIAPALLVWGLGRTSGTSGSLMLNLEALFTIALARAFYREHVGERVLVAALLLGAGGVILVLDRVHQGGGVSVLGLVAVGGAALGWAFDNALAKPLSSLDPAQVVGAKGALGATLSLVLALALRDVFPGVLPLVGLVLLGGAGYGASLGLYLRAQREIGAGRTASVFASGPFWGAGIAFFLGEPASPLTVAAGAAMVAGLALHFTERHSHAHVHAALDHEHVHRHDDGHHDHVHDPMPSDEHTHPHHHGGKAHAHPHLPDLHHEHSHEH